MYISYKLNDTESASFFGLTFTLLELWISEFTQCTAPDYKKIKTFLLKNKKSLNEAGRGMHGNILKEIIHDTAKNTHYYHLLNLII